MSIVSIKNLSKSYGSHQVLKGVTFEINEPSVLALVGPNGSGKTTLLNVMTNLLSANDGTVQLLGKSNKDTSVFKEVSYLKDNTVLYPYLTGLDHLSYIQSLQGLKKQRIKDVISKIKIEDYVNKKTSTYSLGMKQHLLIAMAILNNPKLLILDEPLTGLDPTSVMEVRYLIKELYRDGTTILLSSHGLSEIDLITKNILFLVDGKVIEEDISNYQKSIYTIILSGEEDGLKARSLLQNNQNITITQNELKFDGGQVKLQDLVTELSRHSISYDDISKRELGAEDRYNAIFRKINSQ